MVKLVGQYQGGLTYSQTRGQTHGNTYTYVWTYEHTYMTGFPDKGFLGDRPFGADAQKDIWSNKHRVRHRQTQLNLDMHTQLGRN
jgi:hypothetical protein